MTFGICSLSVIPCRKDPASSSEMVTQLLFGETYSVIEELEDWIKIETIFDHYPCWISIKQHTHLSNSEFKALTSNNLSSELVQVINNTTHNSVYPLTIGASLPNFQQGKLKIGQSDFVFEGQTSNTSTKKTINEIKDTAYLFLNAPYLWGGRSPFGIDCSGFTQLVFKLNGYNLPRDANQQVEIGSPLSFVEEAEAGDLAFFDNEEGKIIHVGIIMKNNYIILRLLFV